MTNESLHVFFTPPDQSHVPESDIFVITQDLEDTHNWFERFSRTSLPQNSIFSYDVFWPHVVLHGNLLNYTMLYSNLSGKIERDNISHITVHDVEKGYRLVIEDLAEEYDITTEQKQQSQTILSWTQKSLLRIGVVVLLLDQIFVAIKNWFVSSPPVLEKRPLFFPYPNRYGSMLPVIREIEKPSNIVVTPLMTSWRLLNSAKDWPKIHSTRTLTEFTSLTVIKQQARTFFQLQKEVATNNLEITQQLNNYLERTYDVYLPQTIEYVCHTALRKDIRTILTLHLIENAVGAIDPNTVVVGGDHPRDRYMLELGKQTNADLYYIPHSIVYERKSVPHTTETTQFVAGQADKRMIENTYGEHDRPKIQPIGRPYLDNLSDTNIEKTEQKEVDSIILGTQPYDDWIREEFVMGSLNIIDHSGYAGVVIIKIHPSESSKYYKKLLDKESYAFDVHIKKGDIESYIDDQTILITINSNVGLEAILLGAYCISYNPFEPFVIRSSYIDGQKVPYETTPSGLQSQIEYLLNRNICWDDQRRHVKKAYEIGGSKERLSAEIE